MRVFFEQENSCRESLQFNKIFRNSTEIHHGGHCTRTRPKTQHVQGACEPSAGVSRWSWYCAPSCVWKCLLVSPLTIAGCAWVMCVNAHAHDLNVGLRLVYTYDASISTSTRKSTCEPGQRKRKHKHKDMHGRSVSPQSDWLHLFVCPLTKNTPFLLCLRRPGSHLLFLVLMLISLVWTFLCLCLW